jgi:hypothetical protein
MPYESNFQNFFGTAYNVANVLVLSYVLCYGHLYSVRCRIIIPLIVNAGLHLTVIFAFRVSGFGFRFGFGFRSGFGFGFGLGLSSCLSSS